MTKRKAPEGGLRRSRRGHVFVKIREQTPARPWAGSSGYPLGIRTEGGRFQASTLGASAKEGPGAYQLAFGATPREACDALAKKLTACGYPSVDELEAADKKTRELLAIPFKRPGQDPGGAPRKREEAATATFTFRLPPSLKLRLQRWAELDGTSPAQMVCDALEEYFEAGDAPRVDPPESGASKPRAKRASASTQ